MITVKLNVFSLTVLTITPNQRDWNCSLMQKVKKGSIVRYSDDLVAKMLGLGSSVGIVTMIHHEDLVVVLSNGKQFIDKKERFVVLSY